MRIGIQKLKPPQAAEKTSIDVNSKTLREKEKPCKHLHGFIMVRLSEKREKEEEKKEVYRREKI